MDSHSAPHLPRSVLLALWLRSSPRPAPSVTGAGDPLLRAVQGDDEAHAVVGRIGDEDVLVSTPRTLADLVGRWSGGPRQVVALLPAPGDVLGVPAPVSPAAADAGECVLVTTRDGSWAAVPEVEEFGSVYEPGHLVTWHVEPVPAWTDRVLGVVGSLSDAERDLRTALLTATEALMSLDVARWREDAADQIAQLRSGTLPGTLLPPDLDGRTVRVLSQAARLRGIVDLATADDGGAVNLWQADQRSSALREVERGARRAMSAATLAL
ncbi:hypothetical protein [Oerskovia flava]|uniref:hypothetical protein n=1 Tax=Oerskovia flava TaxID=2986422 RepID=UPI00223F7DB8|nr:hypothetical protein [Oerskovia sp. JB1-3-2]